MLEPVSKPSISSLNAGDFSIWLHNARQALIEGTGTDVECGDCIGCCSSSYFIHITPAETETLKHIDRELLVQAPGLPRDHKVLPYDEEGRCPMLRSGKCVIYAYRPQTCRNYDCRVFTAAGIAAGENDKSLINERIKRWKFNYPKPKDSEEHLAVQAAAQFIQNHAASFPQGRIPSTPSQLAILAIKVYSLFLKPETRSHEKRTPLAALELANAIVKACRDFDMLKPSRVS
jgi:uncharacterized protein